MRLSVIDARAAPADDRAGIGLNVVNLSPIRTDAHVEVLRVVSRRESGGAVTVHGVRCFSLYPGDCAGEAHRERIGDTSLPVEVHRSNECNGADPWHRASSPGHIGPAQSRITSRALCLCL